MKVGSAAATLRRWATLGTAIQEEPPASAESKFAGQVTTVILRRWAELGAVVPTEPTFSADWKPVDRMINAAESDSVQAVGVVSALLSESSARAFPGLADPLQVDFGAHRWLDGAREESYSDWLAWILERQGDATRVFALLGLESSTLSGTAFSAKREFTTPEGRLDILIRVDGRPTAVIEVKTASEPDEGQLRRYLEWIRKQRDTVVCLGRLGLVVIAVDEPEELRSEEWAFCPWENVTAGLRGWASEWIRGRAVEAAMTLAFCGAVEQNILGLGATGLTAPRTAEYVEKWLEEN